MRCGCRAAWQPRPAVIAGHRASRQSHGARATTAISHEIAVADDSHAADATAVINWAYRGKHPGADPKAWTSERHLLLGIRTTEGDVARLIRACAAGGDQTLLLALVGGAVAGTMHVQRMSDAEAELGMFSVDPDLQGLGIGGSLLSAAESRAISEYAGLSRLVMWVISSREELLAWYARRGYLRAVPPETAPFPGPEANVGTPRQAGLYFVKLVKDIH